MTELYPRPNEQKGGTGVVLVANVDFFSRKSSLPTRSIGSMLPISSPLKMITLIPIVLEKMKRQKSFGHLSSPLKKTRLGSIHLKKTES